jgi:hypothetical protein
MMLCPSRPQPASAAQAQQQHRSPTRRVGLTFARAVRDEAVEELLVAVGYTAEVAPPETAGTRFSIDVGAVDARRPFTFLFAPKLSSPSTIFAVTLPRPLGVVFAPDRQGRCRVESLVEGSHAERASRVGALSPLGAQAPAVGDLLRATTATSFSFTPQAQLFGDLSGTKRLVLLFGCDGQAYRKTFAALKSGLAKDGPVTLVLERPGPKSLDAFWSVLPGGDVRPAELSEGEESEEEAEEVVQQEPSSFSVDPVDSDTLLVSISAIGGFLLLLYVGFRP